MYRKTTEEGRSFRKKAPSASVNQVNFDEVLKQGLPLTLTRYTILVINDSLSRLSQKDFLVLFGPNIIILEAPTSLQEEFNLSKRNVNLENMCSRASKMNRGELMIPEYQQNSLPVLVIEWSSFEDEAYFPPYLKIPQGRLSVELFRIAIIKTSPSRKLPQVLYGRSVSETSFNDSHYSQISSEKPKTEKEAVESSPPEKKDFFIINAQGNSISKVKKLSEETATLRSDQSEENFTDLLALSRPKKTSEDRITEILAELEYLKARMNILLAEKQHLQDEAKI